MNSTLNKKLGTIVSCLIVFVNLGKCEQIEFSGIASKRVFDRVSNEKVIDEEQTYFRAIVGESSWKIVLHMIGTPDGTDAELFFDGTNIFTIARGAGGEVLAGKQAGKFESTGTVYQGPVPLGSEHVQGIWLAFCSQNARSNWPTNFPNLFDAGNYVPDTYLPATVSISSNDLVMSVEMWKEFKGQKYLAEDFKAIEVAEYLGKPYIMKYIRHHYGLSSGGKPAPVLMEYVGTVTNVSSTSEPMELKMGESALLRETRLFGAGYPVSYRSTNWIPIGHLEDNPATSNVIAETSRRFMMEKGQVALNAVPRASRLLVFIFFCILSGSGLFLLIWSSLKKQKN
jgi:hypothetical protein